MEEFIDLDNCDLELKVDYLTKKLQLSQSKSLPRKIYEKSNDIYQMAYSLYVLSKLSIPFYLFCKLYLKI